MLRRHTGTKSKREHTNSCTPCQTLRPEIGCADLCCRQYLVVLSQEDLDDGLKPLPPFVDVLLKREDGTCHYFEEATGNCGAWANRPLVCRTYDCRDDGRAKERMGLKHPPGTRFDFSHPQRCAQCDRPLQLCMGVASQLAGACVCLDCGQPYSVRFDYRDKHFGLEPLTGVSAIERRRNLLVTLLHREQHSEAYAVLQAWCSEQPKDLGLQRQRALTLADLGRLDEARRRLEPLAEGQPDVQLDLAWLDTKQGRDDAAKARIETVVPKLSGGPLQRAHLQLGSIARRADRIEEAARCFQRAILIDRKNELHNHGLKEYLLELMHGSPEVRARVERGLLDSPELAAVRQPAGNGSAASRAFVSS
jgi:Fe-S-cluster containining protein